jgi:hypothetical protein
LFDLLAHGAWAPGEKRSPTLIAFCRIIMEPNLITFILPHVRRLLNEAEDAAFKHMYDEISHGKATRETFVAVGATPQQLRTFADAKGVLVRCSVTLAQQALQYAHTATRNAFGQAPAALVAPATPAAPATAPTVPAVAPAGDNDDGDGSGGGGIFVDIGGDDDPSAGAGAPAAVMPTLPLSEMPLNALPHASGDGAMPVEVKGVEVATAHGDDAAAVAPQPDGEPAATMVS